MNFDFEISRADCICMSVVGPMPMWLGVDLRKEATKSIDAAKTMLITRLVCPLSTCIAMWLRRLRPNMYFHMLVT